MMVTRKSLGRWDDAQVPAVWKSKQAAHKWGLGRFGKGNFFVVECEGPECGMKDHGG